MHNPFNDIQGKWEISNMDDAHYYKMGTWVDKTKMGFGGRVFLKVRKLFGWLGRVVSSVIHLFRQRSKSYKSYRY